MEQSLKEELEGFVMEELRVRKLQELDILQKEARGKKMWLKHHRERYYIQSLYIIIYSYIHIYIYLLYSLYRYFYLYPLLHLFYWVCSMFVRVEDSRHRADIDALREKTNVALEALRCEEALRREALEAKVEQLQAP